jgi:hypothetical protein
LIITVVMAVEPPYVAVIVTVLPEDPALDVTITPPKRDDPAGNVRVGCTGREAESLLLSCTTAVLPGGMLVPRVISISVEPPALIVEAVAVRELMAGSTAIPQGIPRQKRPPVAPAYVPVMFATTGD